MDKLISPQEQSKRRRKRIFRVLLAAVGLVVLWRVTIGLVTPSIDIEQLIIAEVNRGEVMQTLTASGTVIPAYEYTLNAPVVSEIKQIKRRSGEAVQQGDVILELDQEYTALEFEKLNDELMMRRNNLNMLKLDFDKSLRELELQHQITSLEMDEMDAQIESQARLVEIGGATAEDLEKAKLQFQIMQIEKKVQENELAFRRQKNEIEKRNLELDFDIQSKRLAELRRKLNETSVTADREGVITWINADLGKTVQIGEPLVRIANLKEFSIEAVTSDRNMDYLITGTPVKVRINREEINGTITQTLPTIENNTVRFLVTLENPNHPALRPNQRVEVFIVTGVATDTKRLKMGPAISGGSEQDVFVVRGDVAFKTAISKGLTNPDFLEIKSGLEVGDRVILSDMKDYSHLTKIKIKL
ncbi:MAG: hypothetical protein RL226_841 [Bacteroidota bacterium]